MNHSVSEHIKINIVRKKSPKSLKSKSNYNMIGMGSVLYAFTGEITDMESKFEEFETKEKEINVLLQNIEKSDKKSIEKLKKEKEKCHIEKKNIKKNMMSLLSGLTKITKNAKEDLKNS